MAGPEERRAKPLMGLALRLAAAHARRRGKLHPDEYRKFVQLFRADPVNDGGESFQDLLFSAVAEEAAAGGALRLSRDGTPIIDAFMRFLDYLVENWDAIAKIILFVIGLF